jgi:hypothetical protein
MTSCTIKYLLITLLLIIVGQQSVAQQGTVATGKDSTTAGGSISYSIGQIDYITAGGVTGQFAQGVQQSYEFMTLSGRDSIVIVVSDPIYVYPNPTRDRTTLRVQSGDPTTMRFLIHDYFGKKILEQRMTARETVVSLAGFANAMYFISIIDTKTGRTIQTVKLIKVP